MRSDPKVPPATVTSPTREAPGRPAARTAGRTTSGLLPSAPSTAAPLKHDITTRLQTIKAMIAAGDYPIDLDQLAERIVDDEFLRSAEPEGPRRGRADR